MKKIIATLAFLLISIMSQAQNSLPTNLVNQIKREFAELVIANWSNGDPRTYSFQGIKVVNTYRTFDPVEIQGRIANTEGDIRIDSIYNNGKEKEALKQRLKDLKFVLKSKNPIIGYQLLYSFYINNRYGKRVFHRAFFEYSLYEGGGISKGIQLQGARLL